MNTNDMKGIEEAISYNEYIFGTNPSVYIFIHLTYCTVSSSQHSQVTTRILQKSKLYVATPAKLFISFLSLISPLA